MTLPFTKVGIRRGVRATLPITLGVIPFGLVVGVLAQAKGFSFLEQLLLSAVVFAGASQTLALETWDEHAPILAAALSAAAVNSRFILLGATAAPILDSIPQRVRVFGVAYLVDHAWAMSIAEWRAGRGDGGFYIGSLMVTWAAWVVTSCLGYALGSVVALPPGHPIWFAVPATFLTLLVPLWRGTSDLVPWLVAGVLALGLSRLGIGPTAPIVLGCLGGALAGVLRDRMLDKGEAPRP